jgi:hypothetical protein
VAFLSKNFTEFQFDGTNPKYQGKKLRQDAVHHSCHENYVCRINVYMVTKLMNPLKLQPCLNIHFTGISEHGRLAISLSTPSYVLSFYFAHSSATEIANNHDFAEHLNIQPTSMSPDS